MLSFTVARRPIWYMTAACLAMTTTVAAAYVLRRRFHQAADDRGRSRYAVSRQPPNNPTSKAGLKLMSLDESIESMTIKPIGVVRSIYHLCVGTPRQGLLAPDARGRIELFHLDMDAVDELQTFSHIWIVFCFHLNTSGKKAATKIAPPALGGRKIGVFSTRSPHRPNPIGMTLCKLDKIEVQHRANSQQKKKLKRVVCLHISGIDLVDGTPVLDIKPYVPTYDAPLDNQYTIPPWVSQGLATQRPVTISQDAQHQLGGILERNPVALDFYQGPTAATSILRCIQQVLSMDVRSTYQTQKVRQGKSQAERSKRMQDIGAAPKLLDDDDVVCTQQIDNLLVSFTVTTPEGEVTRPTSNGSGAEDMVLVTGIELLEQRVEK